VSSSPEIFPAGLLHWAGHRSGGVRRLFDNQSGRPSGRVIQTNLLGRVQAWARSLSNPQENVPTVLFLVGGPGNGKTEAVESIVIELDEALDMRGVLVERVKALFSPEGSNAVPRLAIVDLSDTSMAPRTTSLVIVQDASVKGPEDTGLSPASLLVADLANFVFDSTNIIYVACVNRGVLDDALVSAMDTDNHRSQRLLEAIIKSVSLSPMAPPCWPLEHDASVAVWPMDVESLFSPLANASSSPAGQLLEVATAMDSWPVYSTCSAAERCPFCTSRELLSEEPNRSSFLSVLRAYELATGKRWTFRDLSSLISFILAGVPTSEDEAPSSPCDWAARLIKLDEDRGSKLGSLRAQAPFLLAAAQYQHALFGRWPRLRPRDLYNNLKELKVERQPTLLGLHHFLSSARGHSLPATLATQLADLAEVLDPALANPDAEIAISTSKTIAFRDLDTRFSHSVAEGFEFLRRHRCLSNLEGDLLKRLSGADDELSATDVQRRRPAVAQRTQRLVRDFACRFVKRSLGARVGVVRDHETLSAFLRVIDGDEQQLHEVVRQVEGLMNDKERFVVALNTTFGESLPPEQRRAVLFAAKQKVRPIEVVTGGRPVSALRFLGVGGGGSSQSIPLTYELFHSVRELKLGMLRASLPRAVLALLDTTRARLAGKMVRDEELLDGSEIHIGRRGDVIVRELRKFIVRKGDGA